MHLTMQVVYIYIHGCKVHGDGGITRQDKQIAGRLEYNVSRQQKSSEINNKKAITMCMEIANDREQNLGLR
jgi:hypothetical protein